MSLFWLGFVLGLPAGGMLLIGIVYGLAAAEARWEKER